MIDYFEILGMERALTIDEGELKRRFHDLSREYHPDARAPEPGERTSGRRLDAADINRAFAVLKDPLERLRHCIELWRAEREGRPAGRATNPRVSHGVGLDDRLIELFTEVGEGVRIADTAIDKLQKASSAVGRALLAADKMEAVGVLRELTTQVDGQIRLQEEAFDDIDKRMNSTEPGDHQAGLEAAESCLGQLGFLSKWKGQLQEKFVRLASLD